MSRKKRLTDQRLFQLIQKEPSVKIWSWLHAFESRLLLSLKFRRGQFTTSAIHQLPINKPLLGEEIRHEREKGIRLSPKLEAADGKTCPACGSSTISKVLNYWCDHATDVITPADIVRHCNACGWTGPVVEQRKPW